MEVTALAMTALVGLAALVLVSYAVEALRPRPTAPARLTWAPELSLGYVNLDGIRVRYLKTGAGPNVVLLHTLRTQLDIFQRVIPALAGQFTVYAYDYPGHGWSDIPAADYAPEDFYRWTAAFLDALAIDDASIVGISIGGTIALVLAARANPRIVRVIAINPYDYPPGGGIRRSSLTARVILGPAGVPLLGATLMRLRTRFIVDWIMQGGVASAEALPRQLRKEIYDVGDRRGQYRGFLNLLAHERRWSEARTDYRRITIPTLLIYGEQDWAPHAAREQTRALIPGVVATSVSDGGHFLSLDRPREVSDLIVRFIASTRGASSVRT